MKTYLVDTNIILRFLTGQPAGQADHARKLFDQCEAGLLSLRILPLMVAEVVFVLEGKHYRFEAEDISRELRLFLQNPNFDVEERDALILGLELFARHRVDFADAYLAATAQIQGHGIASFDRDFKKIKGLDRLNIP